MIFHKNCVSELIIQISPHSAEGLVNAILISYYLLPLIGIISVAFYINHIEGMATMVFTENPT